MNLKLKNHIFNTNSCHHVLCCFSSNCPLMSNLWPKLWQETQSSFPQLWRTRPLCHGKCFRALVLFIFNLTKTSKFRQRSNFIVVVFSKFSGITWGKLDGQHYQPVSRLQTMPWNYCQPLQVMCRSKWYRWVVSKTGLQMVLAAWLARSPRTNCTPGNF